MCGGIGVLHDVDTRFIMRVYTTRHGAFFGAKSADSAEFVILLIALISSKSSCHILTNLHWSVPN